MSSESPAYLALVVVLMLGTIAYLSGCTQFDKQDSQFRSWDIDMVSTEEECSMKVKVNAEDTQHDDTVELNHPAGV